MPVEQCNSDTANLPNSAVDVFPIHVPILFINLPRTSIRKPALRTSLLVKSKKHPAFDKSLYSLRSSVFVHVTLFGSNSV